MLNFIILKSNPLKIISFNRPIIFVFCLLILQSCKDKPINDPIVEDVKTKSEISSTKPESNTKKLIMFFGNSLTAGYGLKDGEDFPSLIRNKIDSLELNYEVVNAGISGETTSGGLERIAWALRQKVDVFVLELGANDMLRGLDVVATEENLRKILQEVVKINPETKILIAGMQSPPNMGADYVKKFNEIYPKLAKEFKAALIPFFLEGVAGIESLNQQDRKHPNNEGQKIVVKNVWEYLEPLL